MPAMIRKELRQLVRDRRTLALMLFLPILLIVVFGYAASFNVHRIGVTVVGPDARTVAQHLGPPFSVARIDPAGTRADAVAALRDGTTPVAVVAAGRATTILVD